MDQVKATENVEESRSVMPQPHELRRASTWLPSFAPRALLDIQSLRAFGHRIANSYNAVAILVLNTLLLFACFELAASGYVNIRQLLPARPEPLIGEGGPRETVSYYASQSWAPKYWHEFRLARRQRYYSYVGWRRAPFDGQTIQIDERGIRLTPGADCSANSFKVFAFGGSTMWGTGSPNWGTIPAYLQTGLQKLRHGPVCVVNFGETAYVSTQGLIILLMQLRSGNVPDLVVFYDGPGDIYAAYQSGRADVHQNFDQIAAKFERRQNPSTFVDKLRSSYSYSLIENLLSKLIIAKPRQEETTEPITYESMGIDAGTLSDLLVQNYFGSYNIVSALAQKYGFKYSFFLQPIVSMGDKRLTTEEQEMKHSLEMETAFNKLCTAVYKTAELESSKYQNFYTMAHIFDEYDSLLWIDEFHVTPVGNQLIAQKMLDVITRRSS